MTSFSCTTHTQKIHIKFMENLYHHSMNFNGFIHLHIFHGKFMLILISCLAVIVGLHYGTVVCYPNLCLCVFRLDYQKVQINYTQLHSNALIINKPYRIIEQSFQYKNQWMHNSGTTLQRCWKQYVVLYPHEASVCA